MVGHGGSSAGSYLADPTSPIPSHCVSIVATSTVRVKPCIMISATSQNSCYGYLVDRILRYAQSVLNEFICKQFLIFGCCGCWGMRYITGEGVLLKISIVPYFLNSVLDLE